MILIVGVYRLISLAEQRKEHDDENGFVYEMHEKCREILSEYNDTLLGRCAICLEPFLEEGKEGNSEERFTDRADLVRID